ncbi:MAG: hypothetical protein QOE70_4041 [Chthoniobacter sp.]|jgi:hypothetical protein|nr:hypothetical protein [Chthoniobacter sp.]
MGALRNFIDENTKGVVNKAMLGLSIAEIASADNKLKALVKTLASMILWKPLIAVGLVGAFSSMGKSIRNLVRDTGSLQAAMDKLRTIQGLAHIFAPFVGGMKAAKLKVAELVNFAAESNLELGGVADAEMALQKLTKGAYTGRDALKTMADTGAATGNSIDAVAGAVGGFIDELNGGRPVVDAAETLRGMGIISEETAKSLVALGQTGASNMAIFDAMTKSLEKNAGALQGMQGELSAVESRAKALGEAMRQKFGAPWTESEIKNTSNMNDAMQALLPVIERVAPFLQKLAGGFSTAATWITKTVTENQALMGVLGNLIVLGTSLIGVVSAVAGIGLTVWLFSAASGALALASALIAATGATGALATAIGVAGAVARVAMIASGVGILLAIAATAYGVYLNFAGAAERAAEAQATLRKAHDDTNRAMERQLKNVRSLREEQVALKKATINTAAAYKEYTDALEKAAKEKADPSGMKGVKSGILGLFGVDSFGEESDETKAEVEEKKRNYLEARSIEKDAKSRSKERQAAGFVSVERDSADREVDKAKARLRNDNEGEVRLGNLDSFAGHFERMRKEYGVDEGAKRATTLSNSDIQDRAGAIGASHLASIGLGGEFGGGGDVAKQQLELTKDIAKYLARIDAKTLAGNSAPGGGPMSEDDNPP